MPTAYQLDANVLLRFLRNDHATFSPRAAAFIRDAEAGKHVLDVAAVTVSEVFYAMKAAYKVDRRAAARTLSQVLQSPAFRVAEASRVFDALGRVGVANVDFGDAYLAAAAFETSSAVASFDADFDKFSDIHRHVP